MEPLRYGRQGGFADGTGGIAHVEHRPLAFRLQCHTYLTSERELEGIRYEVEDDLFPHIPIDVDRLRQRRTVDRESHLRAFEGRSEQADEIGGIRAEIRRFERRL